jgi:xanthine/uracil permease
MMMVGIALATGIVPDLQASHLQHSAYWIGVGVSMGVIGGGISGMALHRMLPESERLVEDRRLEAMSSR